MTKHELWTEYKAGLKAQGMSRIDGIDKNTNKAGLQNAINCLNCSESEMAVYFDRLYEVYPNIKRKIETVGYLKHDFNRLYVFNTARLLEAV